MNKWPGAFSAEHRVPEAAGEVSSDYKDGETRNG